MKKQNTLGQQLVLAVCSMLLIASCKETAPENKGDLALSTEVVKEAPKKQLSKEFKTYWYAGDAEITSYKLEQPRYGQIRDGHAVLIYVTEPFLADKQVKADESNPKNIPVLKLNSTKKYLTGIYPYSIMSSTFYPVHDNQHAIKVSNSVQEWCGHVYSQLNNRDQFEIMSHSYFESEADQNISLEKAVLENEIWTKIRINPEELPTGKLKMIPSLEYIRVGHKEIKAYDVSAKLEEAGSNFTYTVNYPELERTLSISFTKEFPYTIEHWTESFKSGFGANAQVLTSKATKMKALKTPYWRQNGNKDIILRDSLGL
ncbi:MAG: septum formation inhibitor Maf [Flavobacteriaceae bacterium]